MEYKSTLNLPKTEFPMKANLAKREPEILKKWETTQAYEKLLQKNEGHPKFILHDGPPYANGHIHFGHILNKILKDIIVKYKNMAGFYSPYVPGWDCHGLPIELGAVRELTSKSKDQSKVIDPLVRRQACRDYALRFVKDQREEFKRLGVFGDWGNPYLTLTNQYEADIAREFVSLYLKGYVYQGVKPVYWCSSCKTALAEAEVEYEEDGSSSIYVKFKIINPEVLQIPDVEIPKKEVCLVIWTTTPWTLPANLALAVGEAYDYVALNCDGCIYIVADMLKDFFLKAIGYSGDAQVLKIFTGKQIYKLQVVTQHPFMKRLSPVVPSGHVTLEGGTGVVHIAPGHGQEDYQVGQVHNLETLCPVDGDGKFIAGSFKEARFPEVKDWEGLFVGKANQHIVNFLADHKFLLSDPGVEIRHSYPHCWRCKKPIIFRSTEQWFCSLDHEGLRNRALRSINGDVRWIPSWGHDRIFGMIENRPDWCLSRQRIWGVPIIVHFCKKCRSPLLNEEIGRLIVKTFEKEGADAWWKSSDPLLPPNTQCSCGSKSFEKEGSILDVWFDSGVSYAAVLEKNKDLDSPADLYLEGSDQHRGWFHSSLLTSMATRDRAPYKAALTHGFVVDGAGKKYSKSAKNYVPPDKILNQMGAEILRLWVAAEDYRNDIRVSNEILKVLSEVYRKIRNTSRFLLGNLYDFDVQKHQIPFKKRSEIDRFILSCLSGVIEKVEKSFESYEFHVVHHTLNRFFTVDLSAIYLDILKDRLYCDRADGFLRRSAQSTLYDILHAVVPLMSPIFSFTAEEIWQSIPNRKHLSDSVFLADWPRIHSEWVDKDLEIRWQRVGKIRDEVLKTLEEARQGKQIAHSLDAKVILSGEGETLNFLRSFEDDWPQICIASQVEILDEVSGFQYKSQTIPTLTISVDRAEGDKCQRCWNYSTQVGKNKEHPSLCSRCVEVVC